MPKSSEEWKDVIIAFLLILVLGAYLPMCGRDKHPNGWDENETAKDYYEGN